MAAPEAASSTSTAAQSCDEETTGRFDGIKFDRAFARVTLPGYDIEKAIKKSRNRWLHKKPPPAAAAPPTQPETFVLGQAQPAPELSPQQPTDPRDADDFDLQL